MRQTDVMDAIRNIVITASIDASPQNYEICHRYITRSDADVCRGFEEALAGGASICASKFESIRDAAGPAPGQVDIERFVATIDAQLAAISIAADGAREGTSVLNQELGAGAAGLLELEVGPEAATIISRLIEEMQRAAGRASALEASLAHAGDEMGRLRIELDTARREGSTDALTSLPNRRFVDAEIVRAVADAHQTRSPLSLVFCDVDHFKRFNDTWGHKLGDQVLRLVGSQLAQQFEGVGTPARFGGEEFVVILPTRGPADAFEAVERFCATIRERMIRSRSDGREIGRISLSAGVATLRRGEDAASLIQRADAAMYAAKHAGRDRVMVAN